MKVAIFFGSKSDKDTMKKAADVLKEFGVEYKAFIISAHRAGELLRETVKQVEADGFEVIIAGAGLAAALPGVIAGMTTLPVIGVPLECLSDKSNGLGGMDALLSIVQMPAKLMYLPTRFIIPCWKKVGKLFHKKNLYGHINEKACSPFF